MPTTTTSRRYRALLDPLPLNLRDTMLLSNPDDTGTARTYIDSWRVLHNNAITGPRPNEQPVRDLILAWLAYADQHETQWNDPPTDTVVCFRESQAYRVAFNKAKADNFRELPEATDEGCAECLAQYEATPSVSYGFICQHCNRCTSRIGDDYVLGAAWETIGHELLTLLNGDLGRLDAGTLDHAIRQALTLAGLDADA